MRRWGARRWDRSPRETRRAPAKTRTTAVRLGRARKLWASRRTWVPELAQIGERLLRGEALDLFFDHGFGQNRNHLPDHLLDDVAREREHRGNLGFAEPEVRKL